MIIFKFTLCSYDPAEHKQVIDEFQKLEETRKLVKAERIKQGLDEDDATTTEEIKQKEAEKEPEKDEDKGSRTEIKTEALFYWSFFNSILTTVV